MKKILLSTIFSAVVVSASAANEPVNLWSNFLTGKPGQDNCTSVATDGNNQIYWLATDGSTEADSDVTYGDIKLYDGTPYSAGTSANINLTLLKTDASGKAVWCIHSNYGDFTSGSGGAVVTPSGDVVFCGKVRHSDGFLDKQISFTDAKDNILSIDWSVEKRYQRLFIAKCTADGELLWIRTCDLETEMNQNGKTFASDAVNPSCVSVDNEGNIYVGGNFRAKMTVEKSNGDVVTLEAKNLSSYDGSTQGTCGSLFVLKLDSNGYYLNSLTESGDEIAESKIWGIEYSNGLIYVNGTLKSANETAKISFAGSEFTPTPYVSPILACLKTDLSANWVTMLPGATDSFAKSIIQNASLAVNDNNLWYCGIFDGKISNPDNSTEFVESTFKNNTREGFLIKLDTATGKWVKGVASRASFTDPALCGYLKPFVPVNDTSKVYVYGYCMNTSIGSFLRCYDASTLEGNADLSWNIVTGGGAPTACCAAYEPTSGEIFVATRGNNVMNPLGGVSTEKPSGYTTLLSCFKLGEAFTSGVENIDVTDEYSESESVRYFTLDGVEVMNPKSGLYIRVQGGKATKVLL